MRLFRPGFLARCLYPQALFRIKTTEKILYLSFDDGPDPVSTPQLLTILKTHNIKTIFFCNGKAAEEYPELMKKIRSEGHAIGNHGYYHFNGWKTDSATYINDVLKASEFTSATMFRPPFGRLSVKQKRSLSTTFKLILWDIMAYDFDINFGSDKVLGILKDKIRPGSIIVLHDTCSSCANTIIQDFLDYATGKGYRFGLIENEF
ncbi:MAG: polysaccharide deacetylase family protein [Bacteroidales bacterium]